MFTLMVHRYHIGNGQCHYYRSHYLFMYVYPLPAHSCIYTLCDSQHREALDLTWQSATSLFYCHHPTRGRSSSLYIFGSWGAIGGIRDTCLGIIRHTIGQKASPGVTNSSDIVVIKLIRHNVVIHIFIGNDYLCRD